MSDRITWETCPTCGGRAAVGWQACEQEPGAEVAVEFDCPRGCQPPRRLGRRDG